MSYGIETIQQRILELTDFLCDQAAARGWQVFSAREAAEKSGIVSLVHPTLPPLEVVKKAKAAGVIVNVRGGRVRVSPHAYNTSDEIDRFLEAI